MKRKFVLLGLLAVMLAVVIAVSSTTENGILPPDLTAQKVNCYVTVDNPLFFNLQVNKVACFKAGTCLKPLSFSTLGIFSDSGTLTLETEDSFKRVGVKVTEAGSEEYKLTICTAYSTGQVKLLDEDGIVVETKLVNW